MWQIVAPIADLESDSYFPITEVASPKGSGYFL